MLHVILGNYSLERSLVTEGCSWWGIGTWTKESTVCKHVKEGGGDEIRFRCHKTERRMLRRTWGVWGRQCCLLGAESPGEQRACLTTNHLSSLKGIYCVLNPTTREKLGTQRASMPLLHFNSTSQSSESFERAACRTDCSWARGETRSYPRPSLNDLTCVRPDWTSPPPTAKTSCSMLGAATLRNAHWANQDPKK